MGTINKGSFNLNKGKHSNFGGKFGKAYGAKNSFKDVFKNNQNLKDKEEKKS